MLTLLSKVLDYRGFACLHHLDFLSSQIYFQIDKNLGLFEGLKGEFIASGLRVNSILMQTSLDNYTKSSHTIKTAYTFNNIIEQK